MQRVGDELFVQDRRIDLGRFERVWIAGSGKAAVEMATATAEILGERVNGGLIVTKTGHGAEVRGISVVEAAHPVPDASSLEAGAGMLRFAVGLDERDLVIYLLSGGSSSLLECPREPVTLDDLQDTNRILLGAGLDIRGVNAVRSRLSHIKAGGLAHAFQPATVIALVLSDVIGNDLTTIGSGPLIPPSAHNPVPAWVLDSLPERVRAALAASLPRAPMPHSVEHFVIGSTSLAVQAAAEAARSLGLEALPFADPLSGEARDMALKICAYARNRSIENACMIFGGETTVKLRGAGLGGRCQEMAVAACTAVANMPHSAFLACGTDGSDGPTDAAGGLIDPESVARAKSAGFKRAKSLTENDSYHFLEACGGLVFTGPTASNVNDVVLVLQAE